MHYFWQICFERLLQPEAAYAVSVVSWFIYAVEVEVDYAVSAVLFKKNHPGGWL
jgi:hypothetical protein